MGGTLAAIHASVRPERVASLALIASPVRFRDQGLLSAWAGEPAFDVAALVRACGNAPWPLLQSAFQMLRPTLGLQKLVHLIDRDWDEPSLDGFVALERWGGDNVSVPGAFYERWIEDIYRRDALIEGRLEVSGRPALLSGIGCPVLAVTFERDHIVPWRSAAAVLDHVSSTDREHPHLPGGHVGAVVSRAASRDLWPKLSAWWSARGGDRA